MTPHSPLPHRWQQPWDSGERLFARCNGAASAVITIGAYRFGIPLNLMSGRIDPVHLTGSHLIVQDLRASCPIWTASIS